MLSQKRILVSWYSDPRYIPPFVLSENQITVGPKSFPDQPLSMFSAWMPAGPYDLKAALDAAGIAGPFDAIVVWADASGINFPLNLDGFGCPTVLCAGDTHHLQTPLRRVIEYARRAGYEFIVSSHNRHHLHWFKDAGFKNVAWLPGLKVKHTPRALSRMRQPLMNFVGNASQYHPRRTRLIEALNTAGIPLQVTRATRDASADIFAASLASFNASLNGDLNLRVFEILSSGGCLFTDCLGPESGQSLILEEGKELIVYDSVDHCVEQARFLLRNPEAAFAIAEAGHRAFTQRMLPEQRASELLSWIFDGHLDSLFRAPDHAAMGGSTSLTDRLRVYEDLQEIHRLIENPAVFFESHVPEVYLADALDLNRLNISIGTFEGDTTTSVAPALAKRCTMIGRARMEAVMWDCIVTRRGASIPSWLRRGHTISV